ncbi:MAG: type II secretion system F family protein [Deltaproteobacteria bacterium]|nr:type II secretion system F family protein [Deltaproteobacteria bacterium]
MPVNAIAILLCGAAAFLFVRERGVECLCVLQKVAGTLWSSWRNQRELREIERAFPETLDHIAAGLRAGLSLHQACESVAVSTIGATKRAFDALVHQVHAGATIDEGFHDLARRVPIEDVQITAQTIAILSTTGGNLIEVFSKLATTIRERHRVKKKIQTATTQGKVQGVMLLFLPWGLASLLALATPSYLEPLWQTSLGFGAVTMAVVLEGIGAWFLWRIIQINV